jgi:hypothetical protein
MVFRRLGPAPRCGVGHPECRETGGFRTSETCLGGTENPSEILHGNRCRIGRLHGYPRAEVFRQPYATDPDAPLSLAKTGKARSLNEIGAELAALGYTTSKGNQFSAEQVKRLVGRD